MYDETINSEKETHIDSLRNEIMLKEWCTKNGWIKLNALYYRLKFEKIELSKESDLYKEFIKSKQKTIIYTL
jgi:hypothetical protein